MQSRQSLHFFDLQESTFSFYFLRRKFFSHFGYFIEKNKLVEDSFLAGSQYNNDDWYSYNGNSYFWLNNNKAIINLFKYLYNAQTQSRRCLRGRHHFISWRKKLIVRTPTTKADGVGRYVDQGWLRPSSNCSSFVPSLLIMGFTNYV